MRPVSKALIIGFVVLFAGISTAAVSADQAAAKPDANAAKNPVAASAQSIAAGKATFQKYCRFCHGAELKGDGPMAPKDSHPANLVDDKWDHGSSDADIFHTISEGIPPKFVMKGFKGKLTPQELWNVINYIQSLQPRAAR